MRYQNFNYIIAQANRKCKKKITEGLRIKP